MFQQNKMQLGRNEEQYCENVEQTPHPEIGKMITDAKAIENDLRQVNSFWVKFHIFEGLILVISLQFCVVLDKYLWLAEKYQEEKVLLANSLKTWKHAATLSWELYLITWQWIKSRKIKFK